MTSNVIPSPFGTFALPFPWGTPEVDILICALDARDVAIPEIVKLIKRQFPTLSTSAIPFSAVEKRILILDQNVNIDYFKYGVGLSKRSIENGIGSTRAMKHGMAIHANAGEAWERTGLVLSKRSTNSTESLRSRAGRGLRTGYAIHQDHDETWEIVKNMKELGMARKPITTVQDFVPRPASPCRADDYVRPSAVDHSLRKLRSFEIERSSLDQQRTRTMTMTGRPSIQVSAFPKIPAHQKSVASLKDQGQEVQPQHTTVAWSLRSKASGASLNRLRKGLKQRRSNELIVRPQIHITKPSQERAAPGQENQISLVRIPA